jgi:hypothetical protein
MCFRVGTVYKNFPTKEEAKGIIMNFDPRRRTRTQQLSFKLILMVSFIILLTLSSSRVEAQEPSARITEIEAKVLQSFNHEKWLAGISNDAVDMYYLWPGIDGLLNLYEATGKTEYVGYAIEYCQRYQSMGEDVNEDGYLDWYSRWIEGYSHHHVEWRAGDGVARTVALILTDPRLSTYVEDGTELKNFLEKHIWEKWTGGYSNGGNSTNVTHFIGRFGLIALSLYQITGEQEYLSYVQTKGNQLKDALFLNDQGAYWWMVYTDKGGAVDVSHGGDTVNFIAEAFRLGLVFDEDDILRLINTVKKNLWNGSLTTPDFRTYVDGTGDFGDLGYNQGGWIKLAQFDPELKDMYYKWLQGRRASSHVEVHFHGNLTRSIRYSPFPSEGENIPGNDGTHLDLQIALSILLEENHDPIIAARVNTDGNAVVDILDLQKIVNEVVGP